MKIIQLFEDKCVGCNKCITKCPVEQANVSYLKNGKNIIHINSDKCILCGTCIDVCDYDARDYRDDTETVFSEEGYSDIVRQMQQLNAELEDSKEKLVKSEREYQKIFSAIPDLMVIMNDAGVILKVSEGSFKPVFSLKNVIGKNIGELAAEEDVCLVMESIFGALEDGDVKTFEYSFRVNGKAVHREFRFVATGKDQVLVLIKDISSRKQMEDSIKETNDKQRLFNEILGILYDPLDWSDALRLACEKIAKFTGVRGVCIVEDSLKTEGHVENFYVWSHGGVIPQGENPDWLHTVGKWRKNLELDGYVRIADAEYNWPPEVAKPKQTGILKSLLAFPLCIANEIGGYLAFVEMQSRRWDTEEEMEEFSSLSNLLLFIISGALDRKRSQEQLAIAQENTQKKNEQIALLFTELQQNMAVVTSLLNNTGQGILSFGPELCISSQCSSECRRIFKSDIVGKNIIKLLFDDDPEKEVYGEVFQEVFGSHDLGRQSILLELLPERITVAESIFVAKYKIISDSIDSTKKQVMIIMTDITAQIALEGQIEQEREVQNVIVRVIEQYDSFMEIMEDFKRFLKELEAIPVMALTAELKWKKDLYRQVHTFKGSFSMFGLQNLTRCLHELEEYIRMEDHVERLKNELTGKRLHVLWQAYSQEWNKLIEILGRKFFERRNCVQVESKGIMALEKRLLSSHVAEEMPEILAELKRWRYKKLSELISQYKNYVVELGLRMDKKIHPLGISGVDVLVDPVQYKEFVYNLIHIFRNMADHGIETPEERVGRGKDEYGQIKCEIMLDHGALYLEIKDDGRGIDVEKVRLKAMERGILSTVDGNSIEESAIMQLIFSAGFSTQEAVTEISGRGIGLIAIKKAIEKMGGQVRVRSQSGYGTTFRFLLGTSYIINE